MKMIFPYTENEFVKLILKVKCKKEKIKPEKALEMLRKKGVDISLEQAAQVLELLRKFATIIVSQYLASQKEVK